MPRKDLVVAPLAEAGLILVTAAAGWATHQPLVFTSLGPTAYEMIETPQRKSARLYNILVGHALGVLSGYIALFVTGAWYVPKVGAEGVPSARIWAVVVAAMLTVFLTLLFKATQPAALSTTLLIAVGSMQAPGNAIDIMAAVLLIALVGEPLRRLRLQSVESSS